MSLGGSSDEPLNSARSYGTPLEIISSQKSVGSWGTPRDDRFISPRVGLNSQRSASGSDGEWITPRADSKSGYDGDVLDMRGGGGGEKKERFNPFKANFDRYQYADGNYNQNQSINIGTGTGTGTGSGDDADDADEDGLGQVRGRGEGDTWQAGGKDEDGGRGMGSMPSAGAGTSSSSSSSRGVRGGMGGGGGGDVDDSFMLDDGFRSPQKRGTANMSGSSRLGSPPTPLSQHSDNKGKGKDSGSGSGSGMGSGLYEHGYEGPFDGYGEDVGDGDDGGDSDGGGGGDGITAADLDAAIDAGMVDGISEQDVEDIFSYARHGRIIDVERLLDRGVPINVRDLYGNTLLTIACQNGNKRVAKAVMRRGADLNVRNYKGNTPLHYCYHYGYGKSLGDYLVSKGADAGARNNAGMPTWDGI
jgi:hypothetical protein